MCFMACYVSPSFMFFFSFVNPGILNHDTIDTGNPVMKSDSLLPIEDILLRCWCQELVSNPFQHSTMIQNNLQKRTKSKQMVMLEFYKSKISSLTTHVEWASTFIRWPNLRRLSAKTQLI